MFNKFYDFFMHHIIIGTFIITLILSFIFTIFASYIFYDSFQHVIGTFIICAVCNALCIYVEYDTLVNYGRRYHCDDDHGEEDDEFDFPHCP